VDALVQHAPVFVDVADGLVVQAGVVLQLAREQLSVAPGADDEQAAGRRRGPGEAGDDAGAHLHDSHEREGERPGDENG
jgi:hypothetical protein